MSSHYEPVVPQPRRGLATIVALVIRKPLFDVMRLADTTWRALRVDAK